MARAHRIIGRAAALGVTLAGALLASRAAALDASRAPTQYVHQWFDTRDGLPQNLVRAIAQTPDGYLWVATEEGLARFDGARFTVLDRRSQPATPSDLLTALVADEAGAVWAGAIDEGVFRVHDGEVSRLVPADGPGESLGAVRALARDGAGDLWVGTDDRGVLQLRDGRVIGVHGAAQGLPGDAVRALHVDAAGGVWVGTDRGVARIHRGAVQPGPAELAGATVHAIAGDPAGDVWFATAGRGVARLQRGRVSFVDARRGLPSDHVEAVLCDRDGNVWAGTLFGLALVRGGRAVSLAPTVGERVMALFEDAEGALWVGSERGLERLREGDFRTYGLHEGLPGRDVSTVIELPDGSVSVGTQAGLCRVQGERCVPVLVGGRSVGYVLAQHVDPRGHLWVSTRGGSWLAEWRDGRVVRSWPAGPARPAIYAIASQPDGTVWLGTAAGVLRLRGDVLAPVPGLAARVNALAVDAAGVLWAATDLHWVHRLEGERLVPAPPGGPSRQRTAVGLWPEPDGTLWVATEGSGLWRLRGGAWGSLDRRDGMLDDVVWTLLDDRRGGLWFSSNHGVWRMDRAEVEARAARARPDPIAAIAYGEADGMRARECNGGATPAGLRTRDGRLWFPTTDGVAVVDPARLRPRPPPVRATIEAVRVDGRAVKGEAVELAAGAARLEIAYTGVTLVAPERLRFRYRLQGFDAGWIDGGAARLATYTNLPPGSYRFAVEAGTRAEGFGRAASVGLRLAPRFHQTDAFYLLAGTAALLVVLGAHLVRTWQLRAHERQLEVRVREALAEVKTLSGLIPICAWCKKIRDDQGYWQRLESYLSARSQALFSHGMCPECFERHVAEPEAGEGPGPAPGDGAEGGGRA